MTSPPPVSNHSPATEGRDDELGHATVASVGEYASVHSTQTLDLGPAIVNWIVAIARPSCSDGDDTQVATADQDLRIARPAVVFRVGGSAVISRGTSVPSTTQA